MGSDFQAVTPSVPQKAAGEFWGVDQDLSQSREPWIQSTAGKDLWLLQSPNNAANTLNKVRIHPPVQTPQSQVTPMHSDHQDKGSIWSYFPSFCMRMQRINPPTPRIAEFPLQFPHQVNQGTAAVKGMELHHSLPDGTQNDLPVKSGLRPSAISLFTAHSGQAGSSCPL